jgi:chorismate--pyruvate lyase
MSAMKPRQQPLLWHPRVPEAVGPYHPWLIDRGSLTGRIKSRCTEFSVRDVRTRYGRPCRDEADEIGLHPHHFALLREVYLYCGDHPVVFAHSIISRAGMRGPWHGLGKLGNKPLGAALFADPLVKRAPLQFKKLNARHELYGRASRLLTNRPPHLWARRSVFHLGNNPLLVTEVFLPRILEL